jgi:hypothetical protein
MASPHVAGTAALVIASGEVSDTSGVRGIADEVRNILNTTADYLGDPWLYGNGLVDADEAVPSPPPGPDETPPYTYGHNPAPGQTGVSISTNIVVHVADDGDGVDITTIVLTVNGIDVTADASITGTAADYTVTYNPPTDFGYVEPVLVTVDAKDLTIPANVMVTDSYSFTTQSEPSAGPTVDLSIDISVVERGPNWQAIAYVTVFEQDSGLVVKEATVTGDWTFDGDPLNEASGKTNGQGKARLESAKVQGAQSGKLFAITITSVVKNGTVYALDGEISDSKAVP